MILVFHNNQYYIQPLIKYLENKQINHLSLSAQDFIKYGSISDNTYSVQKSCIWTYKDQVIDFSKLTGIYNAWYGLEIEYFSDYLLEDQEYARSEWAAYLTFCFNNFTNCINKPTREKQCGLIEQMPFVLKKAKQANFNVPKYIFSTEQNLLAAFSKKNKYISLQNLYLLTSYQESFNLKTDSIGIIEYNKGDIVILYIIGEKIFSWIQNKNLDFEPLVLPSKIINSAKKLMQSLQLITAEIRLICTNNTFIFYWFSSFPIWTAYQLPNLDSVFSHLSTLLLKEQMTQDIT